MKYLKSKGKTNLMVRVPVELHDMIRKLAISMGVTVTYLIVHYLKYLDGKHWRKRAEHVLGAKHANPTMPKKSDFDIEAIIGSEGEYDDAP